jgi:signal transduction histidine kinase
MSNIASQIWLKHWPKRFEPALRIIRQGWQTIVHPQPPAIEYRQWRDRLIRQRFWLAVGLAVAYMVIQGSAVYYEFFINPEELLKNLALRKLTHLLEPLRQLFVVSRLTIAGLLGLLILFRNSTWGRKYPQLLIILFPWAISFVPGMILGAVFRIPYSPDIVMFLAQAAIAPIYWRLHLVAQMVPIGFYFIVYPLIGLGTFADRSIYSFSYSTEVVLICLICEVGVYLYEQSKQAELEANRRLQLCIHTVTHDLRTPVMGSLMLLQSIQHSTPADRAIELSQTEMAQLIHGNDRLLGLMNTLLDHQVLSQAEIVLHREAMNLGEIVATILQDFQPAIVKQNVRIDNRITADLPLLNADLQQVWRVLGNLIGNAINHNSPGLQLTLKAHVMDGRRSTLKVIIQDNGVGIPASQQATIFEPYTRSAQAQYQPGLGLGLYICRQIIQAHGGTIGLEAVEQGTAIGFTLPIADGGDHRD